MNQTDRRHHNRFELKASVTFRWKDKEGRRCSGTGHLHDISEKGAYVVTGTQPHVGAAIQFEILFNSSLDDSAVAMDARGAVIRVELGGQARPHQGFALATRNSKLRILLANSSTAPEGTATSPLPPNSKKSSWLM